MRRSVFVLAAASTVAGCGGLSQSVPGLHSRSTRALNPAIGGGDGGGGGAAPSPTPNPIDPDSGLKIIGHTYAKWTSTSSMMACDYGDGGGTQEMPFSKQQLVDALKKCGTAMAGEAAAATGFVAAMWGTFGTRLTAAIGGAAFTELALWEAVGVALATIPAWEIILAGIATAGMMLDLYAAYVCIGAIVS